MSADFAVLQQSAATVAPRLLGSIVRRELDGQVMLGKIVETEAYDDTDAASHSYRGPTARTEVMFGSAGHLYVYFTYGMHYCCNIVTGQEDEGSAVLIRAIEPLEGLDQMRRNRGGDVTDVRLANGPAKFCQAFGIDGSWNGHDLRLAPLQLILQPAVPASLVQITTRVGISREKDRAWRFYLKDNPYISKSQAKRS